MTTPDNRRAQFLAQENVRYIRQDAQQTIDDGVRFCLRLRGGYINPDCSAYIQDTLRGLADWASNRVAEMNKELDDAGIVTDASLDLDELNELLEKGK